MQKKSIKKNLELLLLIAVMATIASILYAAYAKMPRRQVGSFEYVRKAENLLDKGSFKESLRYLEKAYAASPENSTIILELANTYSEYAACLAESGDYDRAIRCLIRARSIKADSKTAQDLAIMYSKKAISEMRGNDPGGAMTDFENARGAAASSAIASKNLSVSLFNDAVADFKSGKDGLAVIFLKESSLAYKDSAALELLGDIYYRKADFEKARFYFGKALAFDTQRKETRVRLQKVTKELALARREESKQFPHFELRYDKELPVDADFMKKLLERCYSDVGGDLKYFPDSKTVVFFYSADDFKNIFKLSPSIRAFYDGNIRIPLPGKTLSREELSNYIYHEYTHAAVSAKTNNNCPAWLSEGLAMWEEYKNKDADMADVFSRHINDAQISLGSLYTAFNVTAENEKELSAHYLLAYSVVRYIVDNWGIEDLRNLLVRMGNGQHILNAIDDEFLLSEKEFEKRWKNYVIKKYLANSAI